MVPGRGDWHSMSAAIRRTCGVESELQKRKIGRGRRVQTQKTKKKNHHLHTNSNPDEFELESRSFTGGMHDARISAGSGLTLDRSCSVEVPCHFLGCLQAFCWVEGRCSLAPVDQVSKMT